jgi:general stress protein 26
MNPVRFLAGASIVGGISWAAISRSKSHRRHSDDFHPNENKISFALHAAQKLISNSRFAVFVTIDQHGFPHARMIDPLPPDSNFDEIWIGTNRYTRKVSHIAANPRTCLVYFDASSLGFAYVSGHCSLVDDNQVKNDKFASGWWLFYPEGPAGPRFTLIRFVPNRIEVVSPLHQLASGLNSWRPIALLKESAVSTWTIEASPPEPFLAKLRNGLDEDGK